MQEHEKEKRTSKSLIRYVIIGVSIILAIIATIYIIVAVWLFVNTDDIIKNPYEYSEEYNNVETELYEERTSKLDTNIKTIERNILNDDLYTQECFTVGEKYNTSNGISFFVGKDIGNIKQGDFLDIEAGNNAVYNLRLEKVEQYVNGSYVFYFDGISTLDVPNTTTIIRKPI